MEFEDITRELCYEYIIFRLSIRIPADANRPWELIPKEPPSEIQKSLRKMAEDYEKTSSYTAFVISSTDLYYSMFPLSMNEVIFHDALDIIIGQKKNWDLIFTCFEFSALLAWSSICKAFRAMKPRGPLDLSYALDKLPVWLARYFCREPFKAWITNNGGWEFLNVK